MNSELPFPQHFFFCFLSLFFVTENRICTFASRMSRWHHKGFNGFTRNSTLSFLFFFILIIQPRGLHFIILIFRLYVTLTFFFAIYSAFFYFIWIYAYNFFLPFILLLLVHTHKTTLRSFKRNKMKIRSLLNL